MKRKFTFSSQSFQEMKDPFTLEVCQAYRPRLTESDAVYDYTVGHMLVVTDTTSPLKGSRITCLDRHDLKKRGIRKLRLTYNQGLPPVEITL